MRRFIITSPKYAGAAELFYNEKGTLSKIDLSQTNMDEFTVQHFKNSVPATVIMLVNGKGFSKETTIVEGDLNVTFELFWQDYPLHRNRYKVEQIWIKLSKTDQVKAFYNLHSYKQYLSKNNWLTPMIADRYLRNKEFETEWNKLKTT